MRPRVILSGLLSVAAALIVLFWWRGHERVTTQPSAPQADEAAVELADLPATARPVIGVSSAPLASTDSSSARINKWAQLLLSTNEPVPLPPEVFENWLASGRTNAADLLAARQAGGGKEYLLMALERFPNDPRVLMAAVALDDSPEARRERLDRLRKVAPENALGDYLSARDHFKSGRVEQAITDLQSAAGKGQFQDYMVDAIQNTEELLLQAGKSPAEAKAIAATSALLPQMSQLKGLAQNIAALQRQYTAAGTTPQPRVWLRWVWNSAII